MAQLQDFLERIMPGQNIEPLRETFTIQRSLEKGSLLVQPDQSANFLAFIQQGAFRVYFHNEKGLELTTWFSFEGMFIADLLAYYQDKPAVQFVEAITDSQVLIAQKHELEKLYLASPAYREFGRRFAEKGMVRVMQRMMSLQTKSATERYLELLDQPHFLQKIPLKHLASYLGITDTSLSRIRREISS